MYKDGLVMIIKVSLNSEGMENSSMVVKDEHPNKSHLINWCIGLL